MMKEKKPTSTNGIVASIQSFVAPMESEIDRTTTKGFLQDMMISIQRVDISGLGAQLAYFFLLSFFPLLIFMVTLLPYLNLQQGQIFDFLADVVPSEIYMLIEGTLAEVLTNQNGGLLSIGVIGTIWSASKGINALTKALNEAYGVEGQAGWKSRGWSLIFTVSFVIIILLALVFPVFGQQIANFLTSYIGLELALDSMWQLVGWIAPPLLIFFVLMLMYWVVPNTDPRLKIVSVAPGAIIATAGWITLTYGFSFYINNFGNYSATYGSIGGVIILMLWLYFTGMILIVGGLVNAAVQRRQQAKMSATPKITTC